MTPELSLGDRRLVSRHRVVFTAGVGTLVYALLLGWRFDYLGHYLAGVGVALTLLPFLARRLGSTATAALTTMGISVAAAVVTELWLFGGRFFDPVDVTNLILGSAVVAAPAVHASQEELERWWPVAGIACIAAGLMFRFVVPFTFL